MRKLIGLLFLLGMASVAGAQCTVQFDPIQGKLICVTLPSGAGTGTVTSVTVVGTTNQITVAGTCSGTTTVSCTLSIPSAFQLPGTINKITLTQPATGATITVVDGKTLTVSNSLTLTATDGSSVAFGAGGTVLYTAALDTDGTMAANSDTKIATQKATKTYADTKAASTAATTVNGQTCTLGSTCTVTASLPSNPTACPGGQYVSDIAADGTLTCGTPAGGTGATVAYTVVTYSTTPTFTISATGIQGFTITLTGNAVASFGGSATAGQIMYGRICQDSSGSHTFAYPAAVLDASTIESTLSVCTTQAFISDGTNWHAMGPASSDNATPGIVTASGTYTFPASPTALAGIGTTNTFTGQQDSTGASHTMPIKSGTLAARPATCTANVEMYNRTNATTGGQQIDICNSAGTGWNLVGDGSSSSGAPDVRVVELNEEFTGASTTNGSIGSIGWYVGSVSVSSCTNTGTKVSAGDTWPNIGVLRLTAGAASAAAGCAADLDMSHNINPNGALGALGTNVGGGWYALWVFRINSTADIRFRIGLSLIGGVPGLAPGNFMGLRYDTNASFDDDTTGSGNFFFEVKPTTGSAVAVSTGVPADTSWHTLMVYSSVAGTINFSLDGGTAKTSCTGGTCDMTPSGGVNSSVDPFVQCGTDTTASKTCDVDAFKFRATVSTSSDNKRN